MTYKEWNEKYVNSELREKSLRTKRSSKKGVSKGYEDKYNYGVNWKVVKSKEYGARFSKISDDEKVKGLIAEKSRNALKIETEKIQKSYMQLVCRHVKRFQI